MSVNIEISETKLFAGVVADEIIASLEDAINDHGSASIALSGGSTPGAIYRLLGQPPRVTSLDWSKVAIFWGDERFVPRDDTRSNYKMVHDTLLTNLREPGPAIFGMDVTKDSAESAAKAYEASLRDYFKIKPGETPKFDVMLLGMGEDGHTASLFPGSPVLKSDKALCFAVQHPQDGSWRVTMSSKVLFAAKRVFFIVQGESKAEVVARVIEGDEPEDVLPSRLFRAAEGKVTWFLDSGASGKLVDAPRG